MFASISAAALISVSWILADLRLQRDVLAVAVVADAIEDELLGDQRRDVAAEVIPDHVEHQVERGDAARARVAIAVDREELVGEVGMRGNSSRSADMFSQWIAARYPSSSPALASA